MGTPLGFRIFWARFKKLGIQSLDGIPFKVYTAIAVEARTERGRPVWRGGTAFLSRVCGCSLVAVERALGRLREEGLISLTPILTPVTGGGVQRTLKITMAA